MKASTEFLITMGFAIFTAYAVYSLHFIGIDPPFWFFAFTLVRIIDNRKHCYKGVE